ncbi:hypothetical protein B0H13DRAFT_1894308 [Mycena leptocephala]|nr:hypothetical protein B0H13DRAFT_1894308 [Mycena leptocephala]
MIEFPVTFGDDEYGCPNAQLFPRTTHNLKLESPQKIEPPTYIAGIHEIAQSRKSGCEISMQIPTPRKAGGPNIAQSRRNQKYRTTWRHRTGPKERCSRPIRRSPEVAAAREWQSPPLDNCILAENLVDVILSDSSDGVCHLKMDIDPDYAAAIRMPGASTISKPLKERVVTLDSARMLDHMPSLSPSTSRLACATLEQMVSQSDLTAENCAAANKENGEVITRH